MGKYFLLLQVLIDVQDEIDFNDLSGMPKLQLLDLHECTQLSNEALIKILTMVSSILFLDIVGCKKVNDKSMKAIQNHCFALQVLSLGGKRNK